MRKITLRLIVLLLLVVALSFVFLGIFVSRKITEDSIAHLLESDRNLRMDIGDLRAGIFGGKVVLSDVLLSPRDKYADNATPAAERPDPVDSQTRIRISDATIKVRLIDLLFGKLFIDSLTVDGLDIAYAIDEEGNHTLDPMLDPPKYVKGALNPEYEEKRKRRELAKARRKMKSEEEDIVDDSFNVSEMPMATKLKSLVLRNSIVSIKLIKSNNRIAFTDVKGSVSDLDVDPLDLMHHNSAYLELSGNLSVSGPQGEIEYASLKLQADGKIQPFDSRTGFLNPDLVTDLTVKKGSRIMSLPIATKLASTLDQLEEAGLDLSVIEEILVVNEDSKFRLGLRNYILRAVEPLPVIINENRLLIDKEAWLNTANDEHLINASFTFSEKISNSTFTRANTVLSEIVGKSVAGPVAELLFTPVTKEGRIHIPFVSSGDFNRPKVRAAVALRDLADAVKESLKKDPLSLLKGLLDR
ncbi:MAG: hypothetical protein EVB09_09000 [Verrucomicrobiaceae bacterium]|nr:MAG: hypothetical protein EVB09_09000 [Verrucomicrobiaceae bacterium]